MQMWFHKIKHTLFRHIFIGYGITSVNTKMIYLIFEGLAAVVIKVSTFWDIMRCSLLKVNRRFGGICYLHLQGIEISQARNQREAGSFTLVSAILKMEATCSSEISVNFQWTAWRYTVSQKTEILRFIYFSIQYNNSDVGELYQ
jgi:hypothetical protein